MSSPRQTLLHKRGLAKRYLINILAGAASSGAGLFLSSVVH